MLDRASLRFGCTLQVPANRMYPFSEVFSLLDERIALTGRRVWIAYLLLQGKCQVCYRPVCALLSCAQPFCRFVFESGASIST